MSGADRVQIHVVLSHRHEPRAHPHVRKYLESGYRIADFQRLTDRDALVTLTLTRSDEDHSSA